MAGRAQAFRDAPCLAVERDQPAAAGIEHHDPDRRRLDQRLEIGPGPLLGAVGARVRDCRGGLRGEQHQDFFVLVGERRGVLLRGEEEVPDMLVAMAHRRREQGLRPHEAGVDAERAHEPRQVGDPERFREVAQVLEHPQALGPLEDQAVLLGGEARSDDFAGPARVVDGGDESVACAGKRASAVHDLAQDGVEIEACADAQDGGAQGRDARAQRLVLPLQVVALRHCHLHAESARNAFRRTRSHFSVCLPKQQQESINPQ